MNTTENTTDTRRPRIVIIGAGPGGLCMGIRLRAAGIEDIVILEKATGVGGTWWHNRYPGAECDVPSHLYSFSFEPKRDWSRPYARQPEILAYMEEVAERYGMYPFIRFGTEVRSARWDERDASWTVETAEGDEYYTEKRDYEGHPHNRMSWEQHEAKFHGIADIYDAERRNEIIDVIQNLESHDVSDLTDLLNA
jgi:cation diffusion facilitator CzcD-associated flavoprotein CzcO